ncbi:GTP-binding nuclear protein Ran [Enteropsectra breve]|nr:GTP-binding nuclear protein Ran [Enteropsectra breve]
MNQQEIPEEPNLTDAVVGKAPNTRYKFKICLVGDGGTGKTTFINKVLNGDFISKYYATQGAVTKNVTFQIGDNSEVCYEVWDTAGQEKNIGLKDGYYIGAVAAFFFFDVTSRESMNNVPKHIKSFLYACGVEAPRIIVLGNKVDIAKKKVDTTRLLSKIRSYNAEYIEVSAKTGHNFEKPFDKLSKSLFNDPNLTISANLNFTAVPVNYDFLDNGDQSVPTDMANFVPDE